MTNRRWEAIYDTVRGIPPGRVATYGQIAELAGLPGQARLVGYALHGLPEGSDVPWHRVVNARGKISRRADPGPAEGFQRHLLEIEDVSFGPGGTIDLDRYRWEPDDGDEEAPTSER